MRTFVSTLGKNHSQLSRRVLGVRSCCLCSKRSPPWGRFLIHSWVSMKYVYVSQHPRCRRRSKLLTSSQIWYKWILPLGQVFCGFLHRGGFHLERSKSSCPAGREEYMMYLWKECKFLASVHAQTQQHQDRQLSAQLYRNNTRYIQNIRSFKQQQKK